MGLNKNQRAFALLKAGLWEKDESLLPLGEIDYSVVQQIAEEQSSVGLVAAGMEHVVDNKVPKQDLLQFIGQTLQIEEQNKAMNYFIGVLVEKMKDEGIYSLLVKGQGVAQSYERPLWRASGDFDFFLDVDNYEKAKRFLIPLASHVDNEDLNKLHQGMTIEPWAVELHGTMNTVISNRINRLLIDVQKDIFNNGGIRCWNNEGVEVLLPNPDNDVIIVFTHFINHFYGEGIGLRQVCDWCRLLWKYREQIDVALLEHRIKKMGLIREWQAFAAFAVYYLGMPEETMPLFVSSKSLKVKASKICKLILETGNFGHNKDESYRTRTSKLKSYFITLWHRLKEFARLATIFPCNAPIFFPDLCFKKSKSDIMSVML